MIISAYSLTYGFLSAVGLAVAAAILIASARMAGATGSLAGEAAERAEHLLHLTMTLGQALVVLHLLLWPLLFALFQSLVPMVPGAMCIFGVVRESGAIAIALQIGGLVVVFLGGAWLVTYRIYRESGTLAALPLARGGLAAVALVAAAQSAAGIAFLLYPRGQVAVACCSTVFDQPGRFTATLSASLLGEAHAWAITPAAVAAMTACVGLALWLLRRPDRAFRPAAIVGLTLAALLNTVAQVVWLFEIASPRLLHMPDHHCLYDVLPAIPWSGPILLALVLGSSALCWAAIVGAAGPRMGQMSVASSVATRCLAAGVALLIAYAAGMACLLALS